MAALITTTGTGANIVANQVAAVELRDGAAVLSSVTVPDSASGVLTASVTFPSLKIDVAKDRTRTLSIWAQMNPIGAAVLPVTNPRFTTRGIGIRADVAAATIVATDAAFTTITPTGSATGRIGYMYRFAPTITLDRTFAGQLPGVTPGRHAGSFSIAFTVTAPADREIFVDTRDATLGATVVKTRPLIGADLVRTVVASGPVLKGTGTTADFDRIAAGTSRTFTVTGIVPGAVTPTTANTGFTAMRISSVTWADAIDAPIGTFVTQVWGVVVDFVTGEVFIN